MRLAVPADIHGNLPALDAVLGDVEAAGADAIVFCHATARDDTEIVLVDSRLDRFRDAFAGTTEPAVVLGHTHMPFDRLADCRRFVNPGSVGMPYGGTGAYWALLGPDVTLRRTGYDAEAAGETFRSAAPGYPDLAEFIAENMLTVPSDALALAAFSGSPR
jgi:predicted phosphodiesterase